MLNDPEKLNPNVFNDDVEQTPIRKGEKRVWEPAILIGGKRFARPEGVGPRRGRGIFQQKNIRDLGKVNLRQTIC
jgi:hypothetical protein